jgi:hypothetical protein
MAEEKWGRLRVARTTINQREKRVKRDVAGSSSAQGVVGLVLLNRRSKQQKKADLPVTGLELDFDALLTLLGLLEASLLVDADLLAVLRTAGAVFFVDADLLLVARVAAACWLDGGREGFAMLFVTFPSDVRSLRRELCFSFYLDFD